MWSLNPCKQVTQDAGQVTLSMLTTTLERVLWVLFFPPSPWGNITGVCIKTPRKAGSSLLAELLRRPGSPASLLALVVLLSMVLDSAWLLTQEQQGEYVNVPDLFLPRPFPGPQLLRHMPISSVQSLSRV